MSSTFDLGLSHPNNTGTEKGVATAIQAMVNSSLEPIAAAQTIDQIVVKDCHDMYALYNSSPDTTTAPGPEPVGWMKYVWDCLGRAAMKIPADSPAQDRLVSLIRELQGLPRRPVPWLAAGSLKERELWNLVPATQYEGLPQWMWELNEGNFATSKLDSDPKLATEYINFSAFLARALGGGVGEVTRLSALIRPSPFATSKASQSQLSPQYEPYAAAAAQWILHAGDVLFEMCQKRVMVDLGSQRWTPSRWDSWKANFEIIKDDSRFGSHARQLAARAQERMARIEEQGINATESVIQKFGFIVPEDDDTE
ncbi:hypothetical protein F4859DRAFT_478927 [Xylaria cf. heliscus]|nr:hypothetical protein F4859DRAFT_478927 [Xylaria cf. heliscus]